jgi:hypothetical protein
MGAASVVSSAEVWGRSVAHEEERMKLSAVSRRRRRERRFMFLAAYACGAVAGSGEANGPAAVYALTKYIDCLKKYAPPEVLVK